MIAIKNSSYLTNNPQTPGHYYKNHIPMHKTSLAVITIFLFLAACKQKSNTLSGDAPVSVKEFITAFHTIKLPYVVADTNVQRLRDTTTISFKVLGEFVPDSILTRLTGNDKVRAKTRINPIGRIEKENGNYLLTAFTYNKHISLATFFFDKKDVYQAAIELLPARRNDDYHYTVSVNKEPTFTLNKERMTADNQLLYTRNGYAYIDGSSEFVMVINETNDELKKNTDVYNPLDTLGRKNKFSGDYVEDKKNFVSIRDGKNAQHYQVFVHFEKNGGKCTGELKGEFTVAANGKAVYKQNGDPCVVDFTFTNNQVTVKETGSCGNHRGIRCLFNDSYQKKKEKKKK